MQTSEQNNIAQMASAAWQKSKWIIKGAIVFVIALLLMIPTMYVKDLIYERQQRQVQATKEITNKWAGKQNIIGPLLSIPYWETNSADSSKSNMVKKYAYFLPDSAAIQATMLPKEKHRGIFKVMLYESTITISGKFSTLAIDKLNIPASKFIWNEALLIMSIADTKGFNEQLSIKWRDTPLELTPYLANNTECMATPLPITSLDDFTNAHFSTSLSINGAEQLLLTPTGKSTTIVINSKWKHPSFAGNALPQSTQISDSGFTAHWKSFSHKRNFPQQWKGNDFSLGHYFPTPASEVQNPNYRVDTNPSTSNAVSHAAVGVDLYVPVNGYQKTLRTIKYALLCILLTFAAFFLIETSNKKSAHPFQYGLIGIALILFYTLLLSISEYTGFNAAYIIASTATIALIGWFAKSILDTGRAATILSFALVLIYAYIFSLLQLQDYSLLFGSIGLFVTLAVVMHFSKRLKW
jgi:inner membrane protein